MDAPFHGDDYRLEVTMVRAGGEDRDVHIPVLGDNPYVTVELVDDPASDAALPRHVMRVRTGELASGPRELGDFLVLLGSQLQAVDDAR